MRAAVSSLNTNLLRWSSSGRAGVAIRGGIWSIAGYVSVQLLRTATTLILARNFLGPELFGIVSLVGVFLAGLSMFSELGIVTNIVQHPHGDDPEFLKTAFSIQAGRGAAIWIGAIIAAYPLALFYKQPELLPLLIIAGFSEMIRGLTSVRVWTLNRHIKLREITLLALTSETAALVTSVLWAVVSPTAWALVAGTIASALLYAIGSHFIGAPSVGFGWDASAARDIAHFGGWISLATAMHFVGSQGERLILGKFITPEALGCFSLAVMISSVPARGISQLLTNIYLPMISATARTSRVEVVQDFVRARRIFFAIGLFTAAGFLICGKPLVTILLNAKYQMAGWMLQLLGLRVALDVFSAPLSNLILACGESKYSAAANATRSILMIFGVWISIVHFGIREAVFTLIIAQALSYYPLIAGLGKLLPTQSRPELRWYTIFLALLSLGAIIVCY
jgi:O-antigen/teichoic acid export membrane protein